MPLLCPENSFHPQRAFLDNEEGQTGAASRKKSLERKSVAVSHPDPGYIFFVVQASYLKRPVKNLKGNENAWFFKEPAEIICGVYGWGDFK